MSRDRYADRLRLRESIARIRADIDWLENEGTAPRGGEAAAVLESWGNVDRELDELSRLARD